MLASWASLWTAAKSAEDYAHKYDPPVTIEEPVQVWTLKFDPPERNSAAWSWWLKNGVEYSAVGRGTITTLTLVRSGNSLTGSATWLEQTVPCSVGAHSVAYVHGSVEEDQVELNYVDSQPAIRGYYEVASQVRKLRWDAVPSEGFNPFLNRVDRRVYFDIEKSQRQYLQLAEESTEALKEVDLGKNVRNTLELKGVLSADGETITGTAMHPQKTASSPPPQVPGTSVRFTMKREHPKGFHGPNPLQSISSYERVLTGNPLHNLRAICLNNAANCLVEKGEYAEALKLYASAKAEVETIADRESDYLQAHIQDNLDAVTECVKNPAKFVNIYDVTTMNAKEAKRLIWFSEGQGSSSTLLTRPRVN